MKKWEYLILEDAHQPMLCEYGAAGWELVAAVATVHQHGGMASGVLGDILGGQPDVIRRLTYLKRELTGSFKKS
jgi:hypothetical protein